MQNSSQKILKSLTEGQRYLRDVMGLDEEEIIKYEKQWLEEKTKKSQNHKVSEEQQKNIDQA